MKMIIWISANLAIALASCNTALSTNPVSPTANLKPLGLLEVTLDLSDERNPSSTTSFKPFDQNGLTRTLSANGNESSRIKLAMRSIGLIDDNETSGTQTRFVRGTFEIVNFGTRAFNNLNFMATNLPGTTRIGTMFSSLKNASDAIISNTDTLPNGELTYRGLKPTHGMRSGNGLSVEVDPNHADLQWFTPSESTGMTSTLNSNYPGLQVLNYGYTARSNSNARAIPITSTSPNCSSTLTTPPNGYTFITNDASCFTGNVTFAFKFARKPVRSQNPLTFTFVFVVADETTSVVSQGLEEQTLNTGAGGTALGNLAQVRTLPGSRYNGSNQVPLCRVRIAMPDVYLNTTALSGSLDACLANVGKFNGLSGHGNAMVLQPDGKVVVAGFSGVNLRMVRYLTDGSLDLSFGTAGFVTFTPQQFLSNGYNGKIDALSLQSDGKIIFAGTITYDPPISITETNAALLARLNPNGPLDTDFGNAGFRLMGANSRYTGGLFNSGVALQTDGKIVLTSKFLEDCLIDRFNNNGTDDLGFSGSGHTSVTIPGALNCQPNAIALQPDGKIIVAGEISKFVTVGTSSVSRSHPTLIRLLPSGALDVSFNGAGYTVTPAMDNISTQIDGKIAAIVLQSDGKVVVAGTLSTDSTHTYSMVGRYTSTGILDFGFGYNLSGMLFGLQQSSGHDRFNSVALQNDGRILLAGSSDNSAQSNKQFVLTAVDTNGLIDYGFANGTGVVRTDFGSINAVDEANAIRIQGDGKILLAGYSQAGSNSDFAIARYNP